MYFEANIAFLLCSNTLQGFLWLRPYFLCPYLLLLLFILYCHKACRPPFSLLMPLLVCTGWCTVNKGQVLVLPLVTGCVVQWTPDISLNTTKNLKLHIVVTTYCIAAIYCYQHSVNIFPTSPLMSPRTKFGRAGNIILGCLTLTRLYAYLYSKALTFLTFSFLSQMFTTDCRDIIQTSVTICSSLMIMMLLSALCIHFLH